MKLISYIVIYSHLLFGLHAFCQNYPPINNHSSWYVNATAWNYNTNFWVHDEKDTIINEVIYRKYIEQGFAYPLALIREDVLHKRVYRYVNNTEDLLFDFNLHLTDSIILGNALVYHVALEDSIEVAFSQKRRRLVLNHYVGSSVNTYEIWVEGIGTMHYPLKPFYELITDPYFSIICSYQNGFNIFNDGTDRCSEFVYTGNDEKDQNLKLKIYPHPITEETYIELSMYLNDASWCIYNSFGQVVLSRNNLSGQTFLINRESLAAGVYILRVYEKDKYIGIQTPIVFVKDN